MSYDLAFSDLNSSFLIYSLSHADCTYLLRKLFAIVAAIAFKWGKQSTLHLWEIHLRVQLLRFWITLFQTCTIPLGKSSQYSMNYFHVSLIFQFLRHTHISKCNFWRIFIQEIESSQLSTHYFFNQMFKKIFLMFAVCICCQIDEMI